MLTIRLQRTGTKNKPAFRIVLAEAYRAAGKKAIEVLGHYNPKNKEFGIKSKERLDYWIAQHVSISPTVHNLLVEKKMLEGKKVKAWQPRKSAESNAEKNAEVKSEAAPAESAAAETAPAPAEPQA